MNKHDVIKAMGRFPNAINPTSRMVSKVWKCSSCGRLHEFETEHENPAPCKECGKIFFETVYRR